MKRLIEILYHSDVLNAGNAEMEPNRPQCRTLRSSGSLDVVWSNRAPPKQSGSFDEALVILYWMEI